MRKRIRDLVWGPGLGRTRRNLVLAILHLSLLGLVANWAQPRLSAWLYPPPPPPPATCTQRGISFSGTVPAGDIVEAKKWAGIKGTILGQGYIWNREKQRLELWLFEEDAMWMLEFKCFEIIEPGIRYTATFGEFEKISMEDAVAWDNELREAEASQAPNE